MPELALPPFLRMVDATSAADLPATAGILDADAAAGYVDGMWPSFASIVAQFPSARAFSITIGTGVAAYWVDHEGGDASIERTIALLEQGLVVGVYCDYADWSAMRAAVLVAGVRRPPYWIADELESYPAELPAIPADWADLGCVAWQYAQSPGISPGPYDVSSIASSFLYPTPPAIEEVQIMQSGIYPDGRAWVTGIDSPGGVPNGQVIRFVETSPGSNQFNWYAVSAGAQGTTNPGTVDTPVGQQAPPIT